MHVFLILTLSKIPQEDIDQIGCIWEFVDNAMPWSINGYPVFMSCHLMHKKDWIVCRDTALKEFKRRGVIEIED